MLVEFATAELARLKQAPPARKPILYARYAKKVIAGCEQKRIEMHHAGALLRNAEFREIFDEPMLRDVSRMGCDLESPHYLKPETRQRVWEAIKQVVDDYLAGTRYPSHWVLQVSYERLRYNKVVATISAIVTVRGGGAVIRAGDNLIQAALEAAAVQHGIQDEAKFLQLLVESLPSSIGKNLRLAGCNLSQELDEPIEAVLAKN